MRWTSAGIWPCGMFLLLCAIAGDVACAGDIMQAREATGIHRDTGANGSPFSQLVPGGRFEILAVRDDWLSVKVEQSGDAGWIRARLAEPVNGCHQDAERQLDFMLKHHGAVAFNDEYHEFAGGYAARRSVGARHLSHTRKSLRDALARYLPTAGSNIRTAMLLPYVGRSALCLLVIDATGVRAYAVQPIMSAQVEAAIDAFVEHLAPKHRKSWTAKCVEDAAAPLQGASSSGVSPDELGRLLLPIEIERELLSYGRLIIVPHGMLAIVPFAALKLPNSKKYFIDQFAYTVAPGLTQVGIAAGLHRPPTKSGKQPVSIVVGDPKFGDQHCSFGQLRGARHEAQEVAKILRTRAVIDDQATMTRITGLIHTLTTDHSRLDILYLATHAIAHRSKDHIYEGFLALAGGGRLTVTTLQQAGFKGARLVVLSACQTGLGWIDEVGTIGLARAFHLAGAHEVVMSLWDLPDAGTADLMIEFVRSYARDWPVSSAASTLQRAVISYRKANPDATPTVWAASSVFGVGPF